MKRRLLKDLLATLFGALAEAFDRLAEACEDKPRESVAVTAPTKTTNGHVEATLHKEERPYEQT